jgi:hypothetical protein
MMDMGRTIAPKSDQLNSDDLISGPLTITVTKVAQCSGAPEQPVAVSYEGDGGKPWKPCKSMRRVMVALWGVNGDTYRGRRLTLYRDPGVMFGGIAVGGIRISHMSHISEAKTLALTATRASRKPYTVKPLADEAPRNQTAPTLADEPRRIALTSDDDDTLREWAKGLRHMMASASTPGIAATWLELNIDYATRVRQRSAKLDAWMRDPLPAELREPNADDAASWADEPDGSASPAPPSGAASSAAERSL